jgi:myo-inositol 2-dehydrogenase/D-chiro-inositol 1-dehydrogenase
VSLAPVLSSSSASAVAPLGVGFVGCGFVTESRHLPGLRRVPELRVAALADVQPSTLAAVGDSVGVSRRYASTEELVADSEVDVVAVCVPAAHHVEVALAALEAGKHVLVEKPLALTLEDADRLLARARQSAQKTTIGFNLRWHRLVIEALSLVRQGAIGSVEAIRTVYSDPILDRADLPAWRVRREQGGGALLEKAIHHVDLWRFLLEDEVEEVFAVGRSGVSDDRTVGFTARTRGGVVGEALVSDRTATTNELVLYGESGAIFLDLYRSDGLRLVGAHDLPGAPKTRLRQVVHSVEQIAANVGEVRRGGVFDATYEAEWRAFADAIRVDRPASPSLDDGRRALAIVLAATESASTGQPVRPAPSELVSPGAPSAVPT